MRLPSLHHLRARCQGDHCRRTPTTPRLPALARRWQSGPAVTDRWNHNIHYAVRLLELVPTGARDGLDVGCGEGWFVRELRQRVPHVVGIDVDGPSIALARASTVQAGSEFVEGDFLSWPFDPGSFDVVTAIASFHQLDEAAAIRRASALVRPGGLLAVVGLARTRSARDLAFDVAGVLASRRLKRTRTYWETPAPKTWPPPHSYGELRRLTESLLPGRQFRRGAMFRYVLTWRKPMG